MNGSAPDARWRAWNIVDATAPAERLAMLRLVTGVFVLAYLAIRLPVFVQLGERRRGFAGAGLAWLLDEPVPGRVVTAVIVVTMTAGAAYAAGWRFRVSGPVFAVGLLALTSYRGSWGQLLHFENLFTLHVMIVAGAPAADALSVDARRHRGAERRDPTAYGWPIALAALVVVVTYVIAGVAKLRYGGFDWVFGDSLRNHVAYAAARADLLGAPASPLAGWAVRNGWWWPIAAAGAVAIELGAPVALFGGRLRTAWVLAAWSMHVGILAFMRIGFPYPLFLVAFAPFFAIEGPWEAIRRRRAPRIESAAAGSR